MVYKEHIHFATSKKVVNMNVAENFRGKNIFITGGSGFLGKVLIEKILRTVPDVGDIYVLLRTKKGKTPQERLNDVFNDAVR